MVAAAQETGFMQAWQFTQTQTPLTLNEVPVPVAKSDQVIIDVRAVGLCHSDVGFLEEEGYPMPASLPVTLGHEVAGVISEIGAGVTGWNVGDRVGIANIGDDVPGIMRDGGFAAKVIGRPDALVRIPDNVPFEQAAPASDAGATSHHAVISVGKARPGKKMGIIGFGGLGQIGTRLAALAGATVYVAEPREETWALAREFGAHKLARDIREFVEDELDVIVDLAGFGDTTAAAIETVRAGGIVVQAGMAKRDATIDIWKLVLKEVSILPSLGGTIEDLTAMYEFLASGQVKPQVTTLGFHDIPAGLRRLSEGSVEGRLVARFGD